MTLKKHTLALCISLALVGSLTACSGSKNQSSPASNHNAEQLQRLKTLEENLRVAEERAKKAEADAKTAEEKAKAAALKAEAAEKRALLAELKSDENAKKQAEEAERLAQEEAAKKADADRLKAEEEKKAKEQADTAKRETLLDPEGKTKWRQFAEFIPSNETSVNNPLQASQNGKISPQVGAAAYVNGASYYKDGSTVKDFRKQADRASTNYNPNALNQADINPEQVQQLIIHNNNGQEVAHIHFINQPYSSFSTWKSADIPLVAGEPSDSIMSGYVAVPTKPDAAIENKGNVTYRGHTLAQKAAGSNEIHKGNIELNADFNNKTIRGKLTERNDMLLDSSIKRFYPDVSEIYTTDKADLEDYPELILVSEAEYAEKEASWEKELATKQQSYRTVDVTINQTKISTDSTISFYNPLGALSYKDGEKTRNTGVFGGIFAGDNAQEVVGEIQGSSHFMSFGATEVAK